MYVAGSSAPPLDQGHSRRHPQGVTSARLRIVVALAAILTAGSFTATTSWALYRGAMGPAQCCKSRCPHRSGATPARCCQVAPGVPVAAGQEETARTALAKITVSTAYAVPATYASTLVLTVSAPARTMPTASLFAQRTSLVR